jgi:hypothetical protein
MTSYKDKTKYKTFAVIILSAIISSVIGTVGISEVFSRPSNADILLKQTSTELNKKLPKMIDKETRLDSTFPAPNNTFVYKYTLVNILAKDYDSNVVKSKVRQSALQNYKTNPVMKPFRDLSVNLKYQYFDKKGTFFMDFDISPKDF